MKRSPLYGGRGSLRRRAREPGAGWAPDRVAAGAEPPPEKGFRQIARERLSGFGRRFEKPLLLAGAVALSLALAGGWQALQPKSKVFTQADIDKAVAYTLKRNPQPARSAVAAATVMPSVVRVTGYDEAGQEDRETSALESPHDDAVSVGTGVVIDERGTILTNFHVAGATPRLRVTFSNGMETEADLVGAQPEDDLAVVRPRNLPDDLKPAALASTRGLALGDEVVAVGFPFGIGPSVTSGVISGLRRSWKFTEERSADNLIQFDAAANPGNSGGPLVNRNGEVVGIVTGILNPNKQGVFIGIGFAVPIENAARAAGRSPF